MTQVEFTLSCMISDDLFQASHFQDEPIIKEANFTSVFLGSPAGLEN